LTVSELTANIKSLLEDRFSFIWLTGEISNVRVPASGHIYFSIKDAHAQINAVMFKGQNRKLKFRLEDGMQINGLGRVTVYEPRGSYQIILEYMEPGGIGALQVAFDQLKSKLRKEGLFEMEYKKALPFLPRHIGIITSPSGDVVHDILRIVNRRFPNVRIQIVAATVQGDSAEKELVDAIRLLNRQDKADVAILARGGGSLEDLQAFNSERVARAIFESKIPIISAVGHETDYTIADFVADIRVPTPSAAAELVVPVKTDLRYTCLDLDRQLIASIRRRIEHTRNRLENNRSRLIDPRRKIQDHRIHLDNVSNRLHFAIRRILEKNRERKDWSNQRLSIYTPSKLVLKFKEKLDILNHNMQITLNYTISKTQNQFQKTDALLNTLNPTAILSRGYSITRTVPENNVVRDESEVHKNQDLEILLGKGVINVTVR